MSARRLAVLLLVALLVQAAPAAAAPAQGALTIHGPLTLEGAITSQPEGGALLADASRTDGDGTLKLVANAAEVTVTRVTRTDAHVAHPTGGGPVVVRDAVDVERTTYRDAHVELLGLDKPGRAILFGDNFDTTGTHLNASLARLQGVAEVRLEDQWNRRNGAWDPDQDAPEDFSYAVERTFELHTVSGGHLDLVGNAHLYVWGGDVHVTGRDASGIHESGTDSQTGAPAGDQADVTETSYLILSLQNARVEADALGLPLTWYGSLDPLHVDGTATAASATGIVNVGDDRHPVDADPLTVSGTFSLEPSRRATGNGGADAPRDEAFDIALGGNVDHISVSAAARAYTGDVTTPATAAAAGLALLGIGVYLWPHLKYGATLAILPLYARLKRHDVLNNAARRQIYDVIRGNPGLPARAIHRHTEQSWGTVVYHLRQLEKHNLVRSRVVGRSRNYYDNDAQYAGHEVALAVLKRPRSLQIARTVLADPGLTQEDLTDATGLPQPTASYYARKLVKAKLVDQRRDGRYSHYYPSDHLSDLLRLLDPAPDLDASEAGAGEATA